MNLLLAFQRTSYTAGAKQITLFSHSAQFSCCRKFIKTQCSSYKPVSHYVRTNQTSIHRKHNKRHASKNTFSVRRPVFHKRSQSSLYKYVPVLTCLCNFYQLFTLEHACKIVCNLCNVRSSRKSNYNCDYMSVAFYLYYVVIKLFLGYIIFRIITNHVYKYQDFLKVPYLLCK